MAMRKYGRRLWIGTATGAAMVVGGVIVAPYAMGSVPAADGSISGCYRVSSGTLRVIDPASGDTCRHGETALTWNKTGPRGPKGDTGAAGPAGPKGDTGPAGADGVTGYQTVTKDVGTIPAGASTGDKRLVCPAGKDAINAGVSGYGWSLIESYPLYSTVWGISAVNDSSQTRTATLYVICVDAS